MTKTELKEKLIATVTKTQDKRLLEDLYRIINLEDDSKGIYRLSEAEISAVNESVAGLDKGNFISNEDLDDKVSKWLEE